MEILQSEHGFTHDYESVELAVDEALALAAQISDQNERYATLQTVLAEEPEIFEIVANTIAVEQREAFTDLQEIGLSTGDMYEAVAIEGLRVRSAIKTAEAESNSLEAEAEEKNQKLTQLRQEYEVAERARFKSIIENVEQLAPNALEKVQALLDNRIKGSNPATESGSGISELEDEVLNLLTRIDAEKLKAVHNTQSLEALTPFEEKVAVTWPYPRVLREVIGQDTSRWILIDELPVEPKMNSSNHARYNEIRERHVDQPEASIYASLYLSEQSGKTVTVEELVDFLYTDDVRQTVSDTGLRSRVTSILGPKHGSLVRNILLEEEHILQYGYRKKLEIGPDSVIRQVNRQRIYRAVSLQDLELLQEDDSPEGYSDEFEPLSDEIMQFIARVSINDEDTEAEIATIEPSKSVANEQVVNESSNEIETTDPLDALEVEVRAVLAESELTADNSGAHTGEVPALDADTEIVTPEGAQPVRVESKIEPAVSEKLPPWLKTIKEEVGAAINDLEELDLLNDPNGQKIGVARIKSQSRIFATEEAIQRMISVGYMKELKGVSPSSLSAEMITPAEMIIMRLFNTNRNMLSQRSRQKRVNKVVDKALESYFKARESSKS